MPPFTPEQLGHMLNLAPGLHGRQSALAYSDGFEELGVNFAKINAMMALPEPEAWDFWTFGGLFMPAYVSAIFRAPLEHDQGYAPCRMDNDIFLKVVRSPAFARYLRLYPETARIAFSCLLDLIGSLRIDVLRNLSVAERYKTLRSFLTCCLEFLQALLVYVAEHGVLRLSPLAAGTIEGLRRLLPMLSTVAYGANGGNSFPAFFAKLASGQAITRLNTPDTDANLHYRVWDVCEACRADLRPATSCVDLAGEEMKMCERCECVRYCGRSHQKWDWKTRHKGACVAPTW